METAPTPGRPQSAIAEDSIHQVETDRPLFWGRSPYYLFVSEAEMARLVLGLWTKLDESIQVIRSMGSQASFLKQGQGHCSRALLAACRDTQEDFFEQTNDINMI